MFKYQKQLAPKAFGLQNNGVLCYLNSLTQSLISLPKFVNEIAKYNSPISGEIQSIINQTKSDTVGIMQLLTPTIQGGRQEDVQECFQVILSLFGGNTVRSNTVEECFHIRYETTIKCACGYGRKLDNEPPEVWVDFPYYVHTVKEFESIIRYSESPLPGYKCDKCGRVGSSKSSRTLKRLSEIIVVVFKNKYIEKNVQYFPHMMNFNSINGVLSYRVVAKIDHSGTQGGGHYTATVLRQAEDPERLENFKKIYKSTTDQVVKDGCFSELVNMAEGLNEFRVNDSCVQYHHMIPEPETYMVFYHLV
jgi:hypothetical protein